MYFLAYELTNLLTNTSLLTYLGLGLHFVELHLHLVDGLVARLLRVRVRVRVRARVRGRVRVRVRARVRVGLG